MKALCWIAPDKLSFESVVDPKILKPHDAIVRVTKSTTCGSDLHLLGGFIPTMKEGDVFGHEFIGEVVETGRDVIKHLRGERVIGMPLLGCGGCAYCKAGEWSLCDNTNPNAAMMTKVFGDTTSGALGCSHMMGGYPGCHAEYVRVPYADVNLISIPDEVSDEKALFLSDAAPTGYMAAEFCDIKPGDVVAVWGCGGVGQMAIRSAFLLGAERVIAIDRFQERLAMAQAHTDCEILNYEEIDVLEALKEMTGGRGPDACIDAVGMESHGLGVSYLYDKVKQGLMLESDRPQVLREAIYACRKGGVISIVGYYSGVIDKFPMGAALNKALRFRMGLQDGQRDVPRLLEHIRKGELDPSYLITHRMTLAEAPRGYEMFKHKTDHCVRVVFSR